MKHRFVPCKTASANAVKSLKGGKRLREVVRFCVLGVAIALSLAAVAKNAAAQNKTPSNHAQILWSWSASGFTIYSNYNVPVSVSYSATWTDGDGVTHSGNKTVNIPANSNVLEYTGYIQGATFTVTGVNNANNGNPM
jgi:hypothetical protein